MFSRRTTPASTIAASEFKATCLDLMDQIAQTGGEIVVTKRGKPVVRVLAATAHVESPWGFMAGSIVRHSDIVSPDTNAWVMSGTDPLAATPRR